jgi:toxin ParE1/3/4
MAFRLTRAAVDDITHIYLDGVNQFGVSQADAYHIKLETIFEVLSDNPELARERLEISPPVRIHPVGSHIVIYKIEPDRDILIIRVRHGREDWKDNPV